MKQKQTNKKLKGLNKDIKDTDDNPLLKTNENKDFVVTTMNILNDVSCLLYNDYDVFDIAEPGSDKQIKNPLNIDNISDESSVIVFLRYFEYLVKAEFKFIYISPLIVAKVPLNEIFDMIKHHLKMRLLMMVPSFDTIFELNFKYEYKIKY